MATKKKDYFSTEEGKSEASPDAKQAEIDEQPISEINNEKYIKEIPRSWIKEELENLSKKSKQIGFFERTNEFWLYLNVADDIIAKILLPNERRRLFIIVYSQTVRRIVRDYGSDELIEFFNLYV